VVPEISRGPHWWLRPASFPLVLAEYDKYLVALVRPLVLPAPAREGRP